MSAIIAEPSIPGKQNLDALVRELVSRNARVRGWPARCADDDARREILSLVPLNGSAQSAFDAAWRRYRTGVRR